MKLLVLLKHGCGRCRRTPAAGRSHSWTSPLVGARGVRADDVDVARRRCPRALQRQLHALGLPLGIGQHEIAWRRCSSRSRRARRRSSRRGAGRRRAAPARTCSRLRRRRCRCGPCRTAARPWSGSSCVASAPWLLKLAKMPNVWMLSETPPASATSHSPSRSICAPWIMPGVARGTGRADRVVRAGDAHVQRDLAGRVVGHGPRVVVVRPELRVVVVALELVDFVFGLDVAVLGHADVDADRRLDRCWPSRARRRPPLRWRSRCRCCRPACRGGRPSSSGSAARRSCRRRPASRRRSGFRTCVTPLRPAEQRCRETRAGCCRSARSGRRR